MLLHVTSLPGPFGVGDLGPAAYQWVDTLAAAGQGWWQVLPLNPPGKGDSPYQAYSAFAGNPLLVSPERLVRDGLLKRAEIVGHDLPSGPVDYAAATALKADLLGRAWTRFSTGGAKLKPLLAEFSRFRRSQSDWLDEYTLYMALREAHEGRPWL